MVSRIWINEKKKLLEKSNCSDALGKLKLFYDGVNKSDLDFNSKINSTTNFWILDKELEDYNSFIKFVELSKCSRYDLKREIHKWVEAIIKEIEY